MMTFDLNRRGLRAFLGCLVLVSSIALLAHCDRPGRVERALSWLVRDVPRHPVARDPVWRRELAEMIEDTASRYELPPLFLAALVYRESSLRTNARGALGELGLGQLHGVAAEGCAMDTAAGQLECCARWLRKQIDRCGSLSGGFSLYASGRTCTPDTRHLRGVVRDRLALWERLRGLDDE